MKPIPIKEPRTVDPDLKLEDDTRKQLFEQTFEEGAVIVHCKYTSAGDELIRIWLTTFLIDKASGSRSQLTHAINITYFPTWTPVPEGKTVWFTLIFSPLPKTCIEFDLHEEIPQSGGFMANNILRNRKDVYYVTLQG
jgi:hypothetical protein